MLTSTRPFPPLVASLLAALLAVFALASCQTPSGHPLEAPGYPEAPGVAQPIPDREAPPDAPSRRALLVEREGVVPAVSLTPEVLARLDPDRRFSLGLDRMVRDRFQSLDDKRIVVVTSRLALDSDGRHLLETLLSFERPITTRVVLLQDDTGAPARSTAVDRALATRPAVRLFTRTAANPTIMPSMLEDAEVVLVDLPLRIGSHRPEALFLASAIEAGAMAGLEVVVLDRPTASRAFEGPARPGAGGLPAHFPIAAFHGLTAAELLGYSNQFLGLEFGLRSVDLAAWTPAEGHGPFLAALAARGVDPAASLPELPLYFSADRGPLVLDAALSLLPPGWADRVAREDGAARVAMAPSEDALELLRAGGFMAEAAGDAVVLRPGAGIQPAMAAGALLEALRREDEAPFDAAWVQGLGAGFAPLGPSAVGGPARQAERWAQSPALRALRERRNQAIIHR